MKKVNLVLLYLLCLPAMTVITSCEKEETLEPEQNETDMKEDDGLFYVKSDMNGMDMITDNVERMFFIGPDSSSEGTIIEGGKMDERRRICCKCRFLKPDYFYHDGRMDVQFLQLYRNYL